ncbi:unnamed protein product [Cuscuta campestris]|uniref:Uncharacterized protein n=1 Tax=Cuscuta campestris TaxID=132261 RepID=A0A484L2X0_9ASTE|nr:unnamed protein product [Cuscuta campestris]
MLAVALAIKLMSLEKCEEIYKDLVSLQRRCGGYIQFALFKSRTSSKETRMISTTCFDGLSKSCLFSDPHYYQVCFHHLENFPWPFAFRSFFADVLADM